MTTVIDTQFDRKHLEALARAIFYFGAAASALDGFLTWLVVRSAGTNIEQNSIMGFLMIRIGLIPTMLLRVALGVACFWYVANLLVGRRIFMRKSRAAKYEVALARTDRSSKSKWLFERVPSLRAIETVFILAITWAVVGNNVNAALVWFHSH